MLFDVDDRSDGMARDTHPSPMTGLGRRVAWPACDGELLLQLA
jgi:hypothetical protein